jgi:hypothetical protein
MPTYGVDAVDRQAKSMNLSQEEAGALVRVEQAGELSVRLYTAGVFSEPDFVLYGVLERLVIRGRLAYLGRSRDDRNATYSYALPHAAAEPIRSAA